MFRPPVLSSKAVDSYSAVKVPLGIGLYYNFKRLPVKPKKKSQGTSLF
jgi:hypothetical protein